METYFICAVFDLRCVLAEDQPGYRVYVNDEMFVERVWQWDNSMYLEQLLQIQAPTGNYDIRVEPLGNSVFNTLNHKITHGPAVWQKIPAGLGALSKQRQQTMYRILVSS